MELHLAVITDNFKAKTIAAIHYIAMLLVQSIRLQRVTRYNEKTTGSGLYSPAHYLKREKSSSTNKIDFYLTLSTEYQAVIRSDPAVYISPLYIIDVFASSRIRTRHENS